MNRVGIRPSPETLARVRAIRAARPTPHLSERQIRIVVAAFNGER